MRERVAITGMGLLTSVGIGTDAFIESILAGRCGIGEISAFDTSGLRSHRAGKIVGLDPTAYIEPKQLRRMDEVGRMAVIATQLALVDAGLGDAATRSDQIGMVLGSYTAGIHSTVEFVEGLIRRGPADVTPLIFANTVANAPASLAALTHKLRGPSVTVNHKEASALGAIAYAVGLLREASVPMVVAGGADDIAECFYKVHDRFRVMSPCDGEPEVARPFDRRRNGFILGEGGYVMTLEPRSLAIARGARLYGEVLGIGATASPVAINHWPDDPKHLAAAMRFAVQDAGVAADDVTCVMSSANGTASLDRAEAAAIREVFMDREIPVASLKGAVGEFGAVGGASVAAAVLGLARGHIPPTCGLENLASDCPVAATSTPRQTAGRLALVNCFASGGTNYSVLVRAEMQSDAR